MSDSGTFPKGMHTSYKLSNPPQVGQSNGSNNFLEFEKKFLEEKNETKILELEKKTSSKTLQIPRTFEKKIISDKNTTPNPKDPNSTTILTKKFIIHLKNNANFNTILLPKAFDLIHDLAHVNTLSKVSLKRKGRLNHLFSSLATKFCLLLSTSKITFLLKKYFKLGVFHPFEKGKICWDIFLFVNTLMMFFYIPMTLSFNIWSDDNRDFFHVIQFIIYLCDIVINLNTAYIDNGVIVTERKSVLNHYLAGSFFMDGLAIASLIIKNEDFYTQDKEDENDMNDERIVFFQLLIFCLLPSFQHRFSRIKEYLSLSSKLKGISFTFFLFHYIILILFFLGMLDLMVLLVNSFFFSHLFACIFHLITIVNPPQETWITHYGLTNKSLIQKYLYSLYWSTVTIMTVGYGDITPQNQREILFTLFAVFCGCIVFGFNLNTIASVFQDMNKERKKTQDSINKINRFMESKNINSNLQMRVRAYLKFISEHQSNDLNSEVLTLITKLSEPLKQELYLESYGKIIRTFPLLSNNFSEKFLCTLIKCMEEETFMKHESLEIEKEGKIKNLYFVVKGEIQLFHPINNFRKAIIKTIQEKEFFGDFNFFTGLKPNYCARASKYTKVYKLSHINFIETLKCFPQDYE